MDGNTSLLTGFLPRLADSSGQPGFSSPASAGLLMADGCPVWYFGTIDQRTIDAALLLA